MDFNVTRFLALVRRDFIRHRKSVLYGGLALAALGVVILYFSIRNGKAGTSSEFWAGWYGMILLLGGSLFTTAIYKEFNSISGRIHYLSIPSAHIEKFLSRWLYSAVIYALFVALLMLGISQISYAYHGAEIDQLYWMGFKEISSGWLLIHSMSFLAATQFNRHVALKSFVTFVLVSLSLALLGLLAMRLIFPELWIGFFKPNHNVSLELTEGMRNFMNENFEKWVNGIAKYLLPVFFWFVAYLKITEKEV